MKTYKVTIQKGKLTTSIIMDGFNNEIEVRQFFYNFKVTKVELLGAEHALIDC